MEIDRAELTSNQLATLNIKIRDIILKVFNEVKEIKSNDTEQNRRNITVELIQLAFQSENTEKLQSQLMEKLIKPTRTEKIFIIEPLKNLCLIKNCNLEAMNRLGIFSLTGHENFSKEDIVNITGDVYVNSVSLAEQSIHHYVFNKPINEIPEDDTYIKFENRFATRSNPSPDPDVFCIRTF